MEVVASLDDLPDEIQQIIQLKRQKSQERIAALGIIVAKKREEAILGRAALGIDRTIKEDEDYYLGIDGENRSEQTYTKSMSTQGGVSKKSAGESGRCTAFFNITRQFVDSASARIGDIMLPAGDWNFSIKPTPVPELDALKDSQKPIISQTTQKPAINADGSVATLGQFAADELLAISEKAKRAELRIRDWLVECDYHGEVRRVIEDAARIGTGILRGAYPALSKSRTYVDGKLHIDTKTVPASKRIYPLNFFPDPSCGDNIQNGSYVFERDYLSARQLRDLKKVDGYIAANIDKVLDEGASKCGNNSRYNNTDGDDRYEVWYYFGLVDIDDLDALGVDKGTRGDGLCPAVVVMVNDTVIKGFVNPLDNGEFPYDVIPWQRTADSPWGHGVARQGRTAQDVINASARVMMENMGLSGAPQIIIRDSGIRPADGNWSLTRGKIWLATSEADTRSVTDSITAISIPSMQLEINNIIQMGYKMFEDATGVSFLLQGQQGSAPDTVGGMQLLHQNASSLLRRIARTFDECITEPHIRRYYDWILLYGEDNEKGDLKIEALGSSSLVEREIQSMQAAQIIQMALNPAFGYSPKKAADELLRSWRFDPARFEMDEQEQKAAAGAGAAPPQVIAAQIRAESDKQIAQIRAQTELALDKNDTDRDTVYVQAQSARDANQADYQMQKLQIERELAILKYATDKQISLEKVKADLASKALSLETQKELSASANQIMLATKRRGKEPQVAASEEVIGRAPNNMGYER